MAKNMAYEHARHLNLPVSSGVVSGDPVAVGQIPGVAMTDRDSSGNATVDTGGAYRLSVKGINGSGNSAVVAGDKIYFVSGDTPKLSKKDTGVLYGYALAAVDAGATATIAVKLLGSGS